MCGNYMGVCIPFYQYGLELNKVQSDIFNTCRREHSYYDYYVYYSYYDYYVMRDFKLTRFTKRIGLTDEDYDFILTQKGKKSAAGFLEEIIKEFRKPTLFSKDKKSKIKNYEFTKTTRIR
jgi:hypothetical protein